MNRVRIVLVIVMSLVIGGVVFEQGSSQANPKDPWGSPQPPPTAPLPPTAPVPPRAPRAGGGISVSIRGNKIHIDGLDQLVGTHLAAVRELLRNNPNLPHDVRDKIVARMDRVKAIVDRHLKNLSTTDIDKLDDQLEKMGDELEKAMEGLDADLATLGDRIGKKVAKDIAKNLGKNIVKGLSKKNFQFHLDDEDSKPADSNDTDNGSDDDHDADNDLPGTDNDSTDDHDVQSAIDDFKSFALKPSQKDALAKLRASSDAQVMVAKKQLDEASKRLESALADVNVTDSDVARYVNQVTAHEASIRTARLLAWVAARRVLDADQIRKLEAAARTP